MNGKLISGIAAIFFAAILVMVVNQVRKNTQDINDCRNRIERLEVKR